MRTIHKTILNKLNSDVEVKQDTGAPCLVTVANMSRLLADIERDLEKARGK